MSRRVVPSHLTSSRTSGSSQRDFLSFPAAVKEDMGNGRPLNHWTALYLPLPTIAIMGTHEPCFSPSVFMAVWIVIAMIFVGWIPEVV